MSVVPSSSRRLPVTLLVADDDVDDRLMIRDAILENRLYSDLRFVEDGEQLMQYLKREGTYQDPNCSPRPELILLDLNMPRKDGREALREIKADPTLRDIPVVVLTTSKEEEDIFRTYQSGVNSFITKPVTFEALVQIIRDLGRYWFEVVELPPGTELTGSKS